MRWSSAASGSEPLARWFAWARLAAVPLAVAQIVFFSGRFPPGYRTAAWIVVGVLAAGALVFLALAYRPLGRRAPAALATASLVFDTAVVVALLFVFSFESGQPLWALYYLPSLEAALRFGVLGGLVLPLATGPALARAEVFRSVRFRPHGFRADVVATRIGLALVVGVVVGRLVDELVRGAREARRRADEAEHLRDELGRRTDLLDAANRCARALASSLDLDQAFAAFIRELSGLVPFARAAIVLEAGPTTGLVIAAVGLGAEGMLRPGQTIDVRETALGFALQGETVFEEDLSQSTRSGQLNQAAIALGLRSRVAVPLLVGARAIGVLSLSRTEVRGFRPDEIELASLLGRLAGTAVQNIRAYESERTTAEELRRLSSLRADFVSLVSHELRSPMASVIGAAQTLRRRWRELAPEHRESFLTVIADETSRLGALIGDVLDTSSIEAGTFTYSFGEVDVGEVVRDAVAAARLTQDEVQVEARLREPLPRVRADRERLRQVLANLLENAVKYSSTGGEVVAAAGAENGVVRVEVTDTGPGIAPEHAELIFEKFARLDSVAGRPGTGLGLFIARSIVEAHGGTIEVRSVPGHGATFSLTLPVAPRPA